MCVTVLLNPYIPASAEKLLAALRRPGRLVRRGVVFRRRPAGRRRHRSRDPAAVPEASLSRASPSMVDSHTHLHICEPPDEELVAAAVAEGVTRMVTIGTDVESSRAALAAAERFPEVYAAVGVHPELRPTGFGDADYVALEQLARHPRCVAIGETGLDYYREHAPREDQKRAFKAQIEIAREVGKPVVIHTREADDDTLAILDEHAQGLKVILHCFSMGERIDECLAHPNWWISFAGNVTYPEERRSLRDAALKVPADRLLVETDAPYLSPQPLRGKPNVPANVVQTAQALALERRVSYFDFDQGVGGGRGRGVRLVKLGQNFLVDRNILDVIERLAALDRRGRGAGGRRRSRGALRAARRHGRSSCTWSSSTASLEANLRGVLAPLRRTSSCTWATRSTSTLRGSSRRRPRWSRTSPTGSPRP